MEQARLEVDVLRAENGELRARLAKYVHTIKTYYNQHTPPSRKTITQEWKKKNPTGRRGRHKGHRGVSPAGRRIMPYLWVGANLKTVKMMPAIWISCSRPRPLQHAT